MSENEKKIQMGGQAVIEGVMMRSPQGYAIAVRKVDKSIKIKSVPYRPLAKRFKLLGLPFVRGVVVLFEMLIIGLKGLDFSANEWEERQEKGQKVKGKKQTALPIASQSQVNSQQSSPIATQSASLVPNTGTNTNAAQERKINPVAMGGLMLFSLSMAIVLMVVVPNLLTHLLGKLPFFGEAHQSGGFASSRFVESRAPLTYNLISGIFRAVILITYIWVISLMKDIRRIFEYHGAEHKTVFAYEAKKPLTLENVRPYTTHHPRCGTTFLGVVIIVSIIVFAFIVKIISLIYPPFLGMHLLVRKVIIIGMHILFMPLVAGVSYEVIKYASRRPNNPLMNLLIYPGWLSQYITTKEPSDEQLEVGIASLKAALAIEPEQPQPIITVLAPGETIE